MKTWLGFIWPSSQKARWILAVLVLLVIVWVVISNTSRRVKQTKKPDNASLLLREEQLKKLNQDTDKDGLKDWEEAIYRTDPAKADTDGDGAKDGDEIAMSRDPLIKGPKDQMATSTDEIANSPYLLPNNLTGLLAEKFGVNIIVPRLAGSQRPLDLEEIGNQIADETLPDLQAKNYYFQEKDITTSQDNSRAAILAYDKTTDEILLSAFHVLQKHPLVIFSEALRADDLSKVGALDPYLKAYDAVLEKTKKLSVPFSITSVHLQYLNALAAQREAVRKMRGAESDILKAVVGAREFSQEASVFNLLAQELQKKLSEPHDSP